MSMPKRLVTLTTIAVTLSSVTGCATAHYTQAEMRNFSDLKVCRNYFSERNWRYAKEELERREITRKDCVDLLGVQQRHTAHHHSPFFYHYPMYEEVIIFHDDRFIGPEIIIIE